MPKKSVEEPEVDYRPLFQAYQNYKDLSEGKGPSYRVMTDVRKNQDITQYNPAQMFPNADELIAAAEKAGIPDRDITAIREWVNQSKPKQDQGQVAGDRSLADRMYPGQ